MIFFAFPFAGRMNHYQMIVEALPIGCSKVAKCALEAFKSMNTADVLLKVASVGRRKIAVIALIFLIS